MEEAMYGSGSIMLFAKTDQKEEMIEFLKEILPIVEGEINKLNLNLAPFTAGFPIEIEQLVLDSKKGSIRIQIALSNKMDINVKASLKGSIEAKLK